MCARVFPTIVKSSRVDAKVPILVVVGQHKLNHCSGIQTTQPSTNVVINVYTYTQVSCCTCLYISPFLTQNVDLDLMPLHCITVHYSLCRSLGWHQAPAWEVQSPPGLGVHALPSEAVCLRSKQRNQVRSCTPITYQGNALLDHTCNAYRLKPNCPLTTPSCVCDDRTQWGGIINHNMWFVVNPRLTAWVHVCTPCFCYWHLMTTVS